MYDEFPGGAIPTDLMKRLRPIVVEAPKGLIAKRRGDTEQREQEESTASGKRPQAQYGANGGTMDRIKEALELIREGETKTRACKMAHTDTRTYDRYVFDLTMPEDE